MTTDPSTVDLHGFAATVCDIAGGAVTQRNEQSDNTIRS
jgi:hypothetical protein